MTTNVAPDSTVPESSVPDSAVPESAAQGGAVQGSAVQADTVPDSARRTAPPAWAEDAAQDLWYVPSHSGTAAEEQSRPAPEGEDTAAASSGRRPSGTLDRLLPFLRERRGDLILGAICLVLGVWALVALPVVLRFAIDAALAVAAGADGTGADGAGSALSPWLAAGALAALMILAAGFRALAAAAIGRAADRATTHLRADLFETILDGPTPATDAPGADSAAEGTATAASVVGEDVDRLRDLVAHAGPRLVAGLLTLAAMLGVLLVLDPVAAAVTLVTAGLCLLVEHGGGRVRERREEKVGAEAAALTATLDHRLAARRTVRAYALEDTSRRALTAADDRLAHSRAAVRRARAVIGLLTALVASLGLAAALLIGGERLAAGAATPGEVVMVVLALLVAMAAVRQIVPHLAASRLAAAAATRTAARLDQGTATAELEDLEEPVRIGRLGGEISLSALSVTRSHGPVFEHVSTLIPAGQHVVLDGRDGAELSELLSLLQGVGRTEGGSVLLGGLDLRDVDRSDLRRQVAVVEREPGLLLGTVRENLRAGRPEADDDEILEAARRTGADEFLALLPEGYDTPIPAVGTSTDGSSADGNGTDSHNADRNGAVLTEGQRRRLAITRALLHDAPVVVLDQVESGLTPAERQDVHRALEQLLAGRTALIAGGDPRTVLAAHRVLGFEHGVLVEDGDPAALLADPDSRLSERLRGVLADDHRR